MSSSLICRVAYGLYVFITNLLINAVVYTWDFGLSVSNRIRTGLPAQNVVPQGRPGARGVWPQFVPPEDGDSRCACPGLNAMANHGTYMFNCYPAIFCLVGCI